MEMQRVYVIYSAFGLELAVAIQWCILLLGLFHDIPVVTFEFFTGEAEGDESELEINANITRSVATAEEVSFTLTPTEYDASFGFRIPTFDPRSPNLATRKKNS